MFEFVLTGLMLLLAVVLIMLAVERRRNSGQSEVSGFVPRLPPNTRQFVVADFLSSLPPEASVSREKAELAWRILEEGTKYFPPLQRLGKVRLRFCRPDTFSAPPEMGPGVMGSAAVFPYHPDTICISTLLANDNPLILTKAILHELRHIHDLDVYGCSTENHGEQWVENVWRRVYAAAEVSVAESVSERTGSLAEKFCGDRFS